MSLVTEIQTRFRANSTITALVPSERIKEQWIAQGDPKPTITLNVRTHQHAHDLGGGAGYAEPMLEVHIWTKKVADKEALANAIRASLQGFRGTLGAMAIRGITLETDEEFFEPDRMSGQDGIYHRLLEFQVSHVESIPTFS